MKLTDFLSDLGHYVVYYPALNRITGSVGATIMLCNLIQWTGKQRNTDGWIYKSVAEMEKETGLSPYEQRAAAALLMRRGLIEKRYDRRNNRLYYRVSTEAVNLAWDSGSEVSKNPEASEAYDKGTQKTEVPEVKKLQFGNSKNCSSGSEKTSPRELRKPPMSYTTQHATQHATQPTIPQDEAPCGASSFAQRENDPRPPRATVAFDTPESRVLWARLDANARARGRRSPQRFPSLECKRAFLEVVEKLGERWQEALDKALSRGITSIPGIVSYLRACASGSNGNSRPPRELYVTYSRLRAVIGDYYATPEMRDAFVEVMSELGKELDSALKAARERGISDPGRVLGWLRGWQRHRSDGSNTLADLERFLRDMDQLAGGER